MADFDRRKFLRHLTGAAAFAGASTIAGRAMAQDPLLQSLIQQNQSAGFGQTFDSRSRNVHMPKASLPTLSPDTAAMTEQAIAQYEGIVARGGWPVVPPVDQLRLGMRHPSVVALRARLAVVGDLAANAGVSDIYDSYVDAGVRRFQARHGLSVDGIVAGETLRALNVPAEVRLAQLKVNVERLNTLTHGKLSDRYVVTNIPAAQIEAIENGVVVSRHTGVVGKQDRPSPEINSKIIEINFNPFWTVPVSIVRRDLIPKMQEEPNYLTENRIRIYDKHGDELSPSQINWYSNEAVEYMFKQDPGDFNSLGTIRINFPNPDGVYMHDTPFKNLFGEDFRFASSGCVRVQNVRELVYWLLRDTPDWPPEHINEAISSGAREDARIAKPVPLYWVYVTGWATPDGVVQFRDDIYARDGLGPMVISAPQRG